MYQLEKRCLIEVREDDMVIKIRSHSGNQYGLMDVILIFLIVFNSGYAGANAVSSFTIWMTQISILFICVIKLYLKRSLLQTITRPYRTGILILIPAVLLLISGFVNMSLYTSIRPILVVVCAYFLVATYRYDEILQGFQNTITVICLINLFMC